MAILKGKKSEIKNRKRWTYPSTRINTRSSAAWRGMHGSRTQEDETVKVNKGTPNETKMLKRDSLSVQAGCAAPPLPSVCCCCDTSFLGQRLARR
jgi:hypothetical protein